MPEVLRLGGHGSYNIHGDVVFNSGRAVIDIERVSWSADTRLAAPEAGLRAIVAVGGGENLDDWDNNGLTDFRYLGAEWRVLWRLNLAMQSAFNWPPNDDHVFEIGFRYDVLDSEMDASEVVLRQHTWTPAMSYLYKQYVKLQLNWFLRRVDHPHQARLADDALILSTQLAL